MDWLDVLEIGPECHERFVEYRKAPELESLDIKICGLSKLAGKYRVSRVNPISNTILYGVDGAIELYTENGCQTVEKGNLIILPAHHSFMIELKSAKFTMAWFHLDDCKIWNDLCENQDRVVICDSGRQIYHLLGLIYYERSAVLRKPAIKQLDYYLKNTLRIPVEESIENRRLRLLIRDIEKKLHFHWTVDEMSKNIKYSSPHLHRLFQKQYAKSPIQYLIYLRMERAKYLLINSMWSIEQIAEQVGYNDIFNFSKRFKKSVGTPPGLFRKSERLKYM
jgi:AraC-like DNA-binding protein